MNKYQHNKSTHRNSSDIETQYKTYLLFVHTSSEIKIKQSVFTDTMTSYTIKHIF